ncbi:MAG TPA: hypothetical protein PLU71_01125 [Candidatus Dependentiae bacterium]|nr:hypothetical protein [Candidatus Dependentiae bacterium]HRQ62432.1 hypothetical protein [Candidatus Dependentiae bacterium]
MVHIKKHFTLLLLCLLLPCISDATHKAITIVPVADLVGQPMQQWYANQSIHQSYATLPLCGAGTAAQAGRVCPRIHQLLFNEMVEVIAEHGEEVHIRVPQVFYCTQASNVKHNTFWTAKKNLLSVHTLQQHQVDMRLFPQPVVAKTTYRAIPQHIAILVEPYTDPKTKLTFSVGTRFVYDPDTITHKKIGLYIFHPDTYTMVLTYVAREKCVLPSTSHQEQKDNFVATLKKWAHPDKHAIPYVWGGCSFTTTHQTQNFLKKTCTLPHNNTGTYYAIPHNVQQTKTGFDCAGLIARAAQLNGLPYFCKNTMTALKTLQPLQPNDRIQPGDIIYIPGHVIVISDIEKNLIIEARGYDHGYGKTQEIPLCEEFKDMYSLADLQNAYHAKKTIHRLNKNGDVVQKITNLVILKLDSIWSV